MSEVKDPIFLPSDSLRVLFEEMEVEFTRQVKGLLSAPQEEELVSVSQEKFLTAFHHHISRYQQMYLLLKDMNLLQNTLLDIPFMTIITTSDYEGGKKLPVIRLSHEVLTVRYESPPVHLDDELVGTNGDYLTVASVPLLPNDPLPHNGKSVITTALHDAVEVVMVMQDPIESQVILLWGQFVVDQLREGHSESPEMLN